jgi:hypothetical protein
MQHLFRHIAVDHPVVWVNALGHRPPTFNATDMRRAWGKLAAMARARGAPPGSGLVGGGSPAAVIEPRVLPWHQVAAFHALNSALLRRAVRGKLAALGTNRPPFLITGTPPSVGVVGRLGEAASIYFCMDDFLNFPGVSARMIAPLERRLLQRVDALVATAASLTQTKRPTSGRTYHLPQGVNFDHFSAPRPEPEELAKIPRPRIGFTGTVGGCCDLGLVRRVAQAYPKCSIVLVGIVKAERAVMDALPRENVYVLGARPYHDLPAYVQSFDVGLIPYTLNDYSRAVDPLKLLEYLAAGIPVVSSAIPEVEKYAGFVAIAPDDTSFIGAVGQALTADRREGRERGQAMARQHTWERRAERLLGIMEEVAATRQVAP